MKNGGRFYEFTYPLTPLLPSGDIDVRETSGRIHARSRRCSGFLIQSSQKLFKIKKINFLTSIKIELTLVANYLLFRSILFLLITSQDPEKNHYDEEDLRRTNHR